MNRRNVCMLAFAAAVGMAMASSPQARADALSDIAARGTVRIAVPQDFPPSAVSAPT